MHLGHFWGRAKRAREKLTLITYKKKTLQTSTKAPENPTAPAEVPRWLRVLQKQPLETNQEHTIFEHQKNKTKKHSHAPTMFM